MFRAGESAMRHGPCATRSLGLLALSAARRWSFGKITIKGSLTRTQYANSGTPFSRGEDITMLNVFNHRNFYSVDPLVDDAGFFSLG
jgi:hypothetical protein